ncbi:MAG: hypothetical protein VKJ64_08600 [Leptolyngbyaceae bacterium]|nr:hypothetical protein [Leptolyngbyaceae bacterium]
MKRLLTTPEVTMAILKLVIAGYYPSQHFRVTEAGDLLACPDAQRYLQHATAWIQPVLPEPSTRS